MSELDKGKTVSLEELMVSILAMTDALAKLLIDKGVITDTEFKQKLLEERAVYQRILNPTINIYISNFGPRDTLKCSVQRLLCLCRMRISGDRLPQWSRRSIEVARIEQIYRRSTDSRT